MTFLYNTHTCCLSCELTGFLLVQFSTEEERMSLVSCQKNLIQHMTLNNSSACSEEGFIQRGLEQRMVLLSRAGIFVTHLQHLIDLYSI